jgi:NodT family efflux transporter outer membrane factor (OMF) lipoprotein
VEASIESTRQRFSENGIFPPPIAGSTETTRQAGIGVSYGFDLWGGTRAAYEAAVGQKTAAEVDLAGARLTIAVAVTRGYIQLQRAYEQLDIAEAARKQRESILALTRQRVDAGLDSRLELKQSEAALPIADERAEQAREYVALARHQLAALLGQGPDRGLSIERPQLTLEAAPSLPSVLPADLLGRRPDVIAQRLRVQASQRDIDAARSQFYPNINLSALAGVQSVDASKLFTSASAIPTFTAAIHLPLFDGGHLRANLAGRNADYDLAVEQYNQSVVDALRDVADQLTSLRSIVNQQRAMNEALAATEEGYHLAQVRYQGGIGNYLQVLTAETQLLEQRTLQVELRARKLDVAVNLIRALGGGFDDKTIVGAADTHPTSANQTR